jgi:phage host-nuclease inhibitor protein Gam
MASKRVKIQNIVHIKDLAATNAALFEIAQLRSKLQIIDAQANEQINIIKDKAESQAKTHLDRVEALENGIYAFSQYNKDELFSEKKKTQELQFGYIGYRKSTKVTTKRDTLEKLKEFGFEDAIRTQEAINKEVLKDWPDERLKMVGAKKRSDDSFWYEIKEEEITGYTGRGGSSTKPVA